MVTLISSAPMKQISASDVVVGDVILTWLGKIPVSTRCSANAYRYNIASIVVNGTNITFSSERKGDLTYSKDDLVYILS